MKIKPLEFIILMETIVCIYRNYSRYTKITKVLVILRIVMEIMLAVANVWVRYTYKIFTRNTELMYFFLSSSNVLVLLPLVCAKSSMFQKFVKNLEKQYKYFEPDEKMLSNLDRKQKFYTFLIIIFDIVKLYMFIAFALRVYSDIDGINLPLFCVVQFNVYICDLRYLYEFVVVIIFLRVMAGQLSSINESIDKEILRIVNNPTVTGKRMKLLDRWCDAYTNIKESSRLFNSVFGLQLSIMFSTIILYYIILLYALTTLTVLGIFYPSQKFVYTSTLIAFLLILYALSLEAQRMQNVSSELERKLCKFLLHCLTEPEYRERTQDLLRVVRTRPIRTQSYGARTVDMCLLPSYIALCSSYSIVALQFNNII